MREDTNNKRTVFDRQGAAFHTSLRIRNSDTDQFLHVNNAAMASYFEEARMAIFQEDTLAACMRGKNVVVAHLGIDFLKEIFYPGDIGIWTTGIKVGTSSFSLMQGLYVGDTLCAQAKAVCVLMDSANARPTTIPDAMRERLMAPQEGFRPTLHSNDQTADR